MQICYQYFNRKNYNNWLMDFEALEYVEHNRNTYIVNVYPCMPKSYDNQIEQMLLQYGFIIYKKELKLNFNGLFNLKQIQYRGEKWIEDTKI
ncbi:MAG: hypothetical protein LBD57_04070 [Endomicrobium sp.]|uniref:hypothetical protein n=1 Tax=Candidatus Endomicrobiellum cubanum TaxID=3242325 RepID=UPI0028212A8B|nr:hypothetical protein [Endomicrobium sp.]